MKFRFPGRIALTDFTEELRPLVEMLNKNGLSLVTDLQISLRAFNEKDEFYLRTPDGHPIAVTYGLQAASASTAKSGSARRVPLENFEVTNAPKALQLGRGITALFSND
ncbi:hypothetical protein SAMN05428974_1495 [Sphingopyxis sp. YR583]|uniref:hypothetical protein n=1 Tax=Sphingopyxis sp. YR583 TaxID=1881047 RepID=UPI0008A769EC|nr:hypothetical protein [Sphingopyxis sp. YR583]SEH15677.1 hypothetical protein SAMN05428974_1495 [Sphingopyxis sp. YR583]